MEEFAVTAQAPPLAATSASGTASAVSWAAILAGAAVAAAVSLLLTVLATGLDIAALHAASATSVTAIAAIALLATQWISAAGGGYITGRLRTKWVGTHTHEVFFRDTAHGFIMWAVATLIVATVLVSVGSSLVGANVRAAASGAASSAGGTTAARGAVNPYDLDMLFRAPVSREANPEQVDDARAQAGRILARGLATGDVPGADRTYLAQLVSAKARIPEAEAQRRVNDSVEQLGAMELKARKAAQAAAVFTALSMLVGAFIACVAAALGGHRRDLHP